MHIGPLCVKSSLASVFMPDALHPAQAMQSIDSYRGIQ